MMFIESIAGKICSNYRICCARHASAAHTAPAKVNGQAPVIPDLLCSSAYPEFSRCGDLGDFSRVASLCRFASSVSWSLGFFQVLLVLRSRRIIDTTPSRQADSCLENPCSMLCVYMDEPLPQKGIS